MGRKSRNKGKRGEREAAKYLSNILGIPLRRGVQYKGTPDSPDIAGFERLHPEVKRDERTIGKALYKALEQAEEESGDATPFVISRRNYHEWVIAVTGSNLLSFVKAVHQLLDEKNDPT